MWRRKKKKKPDEHLDVDGEFDAPSVLDLVNISGKPKPQTYGQYLWGLMFGSEKEAFIDKLAEMDPESAEEILENQEYPNQAKEMYLERMSDDNSHDEGGSDPDEGDGNNEYDDDYDFYGDEDTQEHGTRVNPEESIAYTNDWLTATKDWGDNGPDGDEESEPDDNRDNIYYHEHNDTHEAGDDDKEIERDEAYRETEYSPDEDFEQNFDEAAWHEVDVEGDVDADIDTDTAESDSDAGSDADADGYHDSYGGYDIDFDGIDMDWDVDWGDFQ